MGDPMGSYEVRILGLVHDAEQFFSLESYFRDYAFLTDDDVIRELK